MTKKKDRTIMSELCGDAYCDRADKLSVLSAALDFVSKGTKYRTDAIVIIKGCCPYYFDNDDSENLDHTYDRIKIDYDKENRLNKTQSASSD